MKSVNRVCDQYNTDHPLVLNVENHLMGIHACMHTQNLVL